jgi:polyphosphate kinase
VKVPNNVPRFVPVGPVGRTATFLPLEDLIAAHLQHLFPGLDVVSHHLFRVTRNADVEVEEDRDEDLLQALERELARRRFGPAVRLEVTESMDPEILEVLLSELEMEPEDVLQVPGLLDLASLMQLYDLDRPELKYEPFVPATHPRLAEGETPKSFFVLAIKQTLYRTSGDSPIVTALIEAAEAGKQVVVIVEIKARFDEEANISWARSLERAGCHVIYGLVGLKTHCKTALVVRREHGVLRRYCHVGTGNYNPKTARLYEDLGILTADPRVGADLTDLFNTLTGYSRQRNYRMLMVAPHGIRAGLIEKIRREASNAAEGRPSGIRIKVNSLVDERIIDALYEASRAGVPVELLIRGICALRPGVPGLSESIRVRSIVGRFLEHSRAMSFDNDGDPEWWIGSSDLMHRNLDRRVEVLLRVCDEGARAELHEIFESAMAPGVRCWELRSDGCWTRTGERDYQVELLHRAGELAG